jgi:putative DNA primase/helicase
MNAETIKIFSSGRWPEIIRSLAPHLSDMVERGRRHGPCPLCGGKDRARCHNDFEESGGIICNQCGGGADGLGVLMWANGWTFPETLEAVASYLGLNNGVAPALHQRTPKPKKDWRKEHGEVMAIWEAAIPNHSRLNEYLEYRGLSSDQPDTLRLHPSLEYWYDRKSYEKFPCIVSLITRDSSPVGIHRTFLDLDSPGKAPVPKPKLSKKCGDSMTGGCIPLFEFDQEKPLVLCEGIETALAVHQMTGYPVWACVSSTMMAKVELPDNVKSVIIGADKDQSGAGQDSANRLAQRLIGEGREIKISLPPMEIPKGSNGIDWLDYYLIKEVACV